MKRKRYTEAPTAGLGFTAHAPAPLRNASRAGCVSTALPLSRVEPGLNRVDHHRRERDFLIEGVLAQTLMKIDREMNRGLVAADSTVERTGNRERRQPPSRPTHSQRANKPGQHRSQPARWHSAP